MTLCSMTTEMGAKAGLIAPDAQTSAYAPVPDWLAVDDNANYCDRIVVDLGEIQPWVACPPSVDSIASAGSLNDVQQMDTIIASHDIVAADAYAATLFGLTGADISYVKAAADMGLGTIDLDAVKVEEVSV